MLGQAVRIQNSPRDPIYGESQNIELGVLQCSTLNLNEFEMVCVDVE